MKLFPSYDSQKTEWISDDKLEPARGLPEGYASFPTTLTTILKLKLFPSYFTGVHINQDLIRCVTMGVYMGFWVHGGSWLIWFPANINTTVRKLNGLVLLILRRMGT